MSHNLSNIVYTNIFPLHHLPSKQSFNFSQSRERERERLDEREKGKDLLRERMKVCVRETER